MSLGVFSLSLAVKDIAASRSFYEKLGFEQLDGKQDEGWLILTNGDANIGLFQGMFENNILTFNPGWGAGGRPLDEFEDIREIQKDLKSKGIAFEQEADEESAGPASFVITDPDGNQILLDQHR